MLNYLFGVTSCDRYEVDLNLKVQGLYELPQVKQPALISHPEISCERNAITWTSSHGAV